MSKRLLALAFALSLIPIAAAAQDTSAPSAPSDAQRQALRQTFEQFGQQEEQLREQLRGQILSGLTPVHRRAIAAEIGDLAVAENPDPAATAKRIDMILSPGERQRIIQAHQAFATQTHTLYDQARAQILQMMPAGHSPMGDHRMMGQGMPQEMNDAGWIVLHALPPHAPHMNMVGPVQVPDGDHPEGGPPPR
jgi:hypothetical protein